MEISLTIMVGRFLARECEVSHIIHPNELSEPKAETHEPLVQSQEDEVGGNPKHLKCPKCGDVPLHYDLHLKACKGKRKG